MLKKINKKISRFIIMWYCGFLFGWDCFKVVCRAYLGREQRNITNGYLNQTSNKLLKTVKADYKIFFDDNFSYIAAKPRIYMSNHMSLFDTPLFYATIDDTIRIVTKKELTRVPVIGKAILSSEHAIVDRAAKDHHSFFDDAKNKLKNGIALWFFPEGTRSKNGELLPFKTGGFRLASEIGAQIIPVGIVGTNHILRAGKLMPHHDKKVEIRLGQPIDASLHSVEELLGVVRKQIGELCRLG
jgi:1-acyl-sn-glycerol-3-phosphate acyltransferase